MYSYIILEKKIRLACNYYIYKPDLLLRLKPKIFFSFELSGTVVKNNELPLES